jgi:hypothetical protein
MDGFTWGNLATDLGASAGALAATVSAQPWTPVVTDFAVSSAVSAAAYGAVGFVSAATYTSLAAPFIGAAMLAAGSVAAAPVVGLVVIGAGTAVGGHYAYEWAIGEVREHFYKQRPMDPKAEMAGRLTGSVIGGFLGVQYGIDVGQQILFAWRYPDYVTYEAHARGLTETAFARDRALIDPDGLRGSLYHLDHMTSVRQGYAMRLLPEYIAAPSNLRMLPAWQNLQEGARLGMTLGARPLACSVVRIAC